WAGSCWYYLRYLDPHNKKKFVDKKIMDYWLPVDLYVGGAEHAVLHLLYARFWHKVLFDLKLVNTKEPFQRLINQGMITSFAYQRKNKTLVPTDEIKEISPDVFEEIATGEKLERVVAKMSKSLKNVINPDDVIRDYGADSVRMYEMFMGPLEVSKPWNTQGLIGVHRFLEKIWTTSEKPLVDISLNESDLEKYKKLLHKTIKKVTEDTKNLNFNTAISQMMIFMNDVSKMESLPRELWSDFVKLLSVYAPHVGEELWQKLGNTNTIAYESWPTYNEDFCKDATATIVVQVNGKIRDKFEVEQNTPKEELEKRALATEGAKKFMEGASPKKIITVPNKLVNIVM
ncbi:MAG: class I tRNA ligase family protein, partial [Culicoidibacterales bacterium]